MTLVEALGIRTGDVVAFVGGGGKTSLMFGIARQWGNGVVVTTTTRIYEPPPEPGLSLVVEADPDALVRACRRAALAGGGGILVGARAAEKSGWRTKLVGLDPAWVGVLKTALAPGLVLVEADGAAGKPLKAPAWYEPVVPPAATLVVPVCGADVVGQPLTAEHVHRPDLVGRLASLPLGVPVTPEIVALVLMHPDGGARGVPPGARFVPVVNKADAEERLAAARRVAAALLDRGAGRVVVTAARAAQPVIGVITPAGEREGAHGNG